MNKLKSTSDDEDFLSRAWANAVACHQQGRFAEAELLYLQLLAERPDDVVVLERLAGVLSRQGKYKKAIDYYRH